MIFINEDRKNDTNQIRTDAGKPMGTLIPRLNHSAIVSTMISIFTFYELIKFCVIFQLKLIKNNEFKKQFKM